jgi:peptidoglycan lytic transglycosylase
MTTRGPVRWSARTIAVGVAIWMCGVPFGRALEAPDSVAHAQTSLWPSVDELWLAPVNDPVVPSDLARAVSLMAADRLDDAVPVLVQQTGDPELGTYAHLYLGRAELLLGHEDQAITSARIILDHSPGGYLGEAALWLLADAYEASNKWPEAETTWQALTGLRSASLSQAFLRLGKAAEHVHDVEVARGAYARVHYDWPLSDEAPEAEAGLARVGGPSGPDADRLELARAQTLLTGRRYTDARKAFQSLRTRVGDDERPAIDLRLAECDYYLRKYATARDELAAYQAHAPGASAEAEFYAVGTLRGLKRDAEYVARSWDFAQANPGLPLAEKALNELATYYILNNDDAHAADVFSQMYAAFPAGAFTDRAAWKAGWWAYKSANYRETIRIFESAAASMRRADYRPSWLYWAARSHEALGDRDGALAGYRHVVADYRNSYYGREATQAIERLGGRAAVTLAVARREPAPGVTPGAPPPSAHVIRLLLAAGLYDDAIAEVRKAQLDYGNTPVLDATLAYALNRKGELRAAISAMRRAYPQFMADGGEALPRDILSVIFPVAHWDLIRRYANDRHLDPYLVAALVAQESTFQADIRSSANAWGLMQIVPSTGRRYAPKVGIRGFTTRRLADPDVNVRIGTAYLADLIDQFNDVPSALAAYNAGESRVSRWRAERPGIGQDEFIDDIPFPETQNYVKRIIGTAEDYRLLYGAGSVAAMRESAR